MNSKNFRLQTIARLGLITLGLMGLLYYLLVDPNYIRVFFIGVFVSGLLVNLFRYIDTTNRDTSNFLLSILNDDFTNKYTKDHKSEAFDELYDSFNLINTKLAGLNAEREGQYQYINTLIQQVNVGILSFDTGLRVQLINDAMKQILGIDHLVKLTAIADVDQVLFETISTMKGGASKLIKLTSPQGIRNVSVSASVFVLRGKEYTLISIQDISQELGQHEVEAWQKLIRVLTHEIMNSVSPIASLSDSLHTLVKSERHEALSNSDKENLVLGLEAIKERSSGLMHFTKEYRTLTRIPQLHTRAIEMAAFVRQVETFFRATLVDSTIQFDIKNECPLASCEVDPDLLSQVLINLLKNAKEAILENNIANGKISLLVTKSTADRYLFSVEDNAGGIPEDIADQVFIPFYTSKATGSGIGLSLAKQIMQLHGGEVSFTNEETGARFRVLV